MPRLFRRPRPLLAAVVLTVALAIEGVARAIRAALPLAMVFALALALALAVRAHAADRLPLPAALEPVELPDLRPEALELRDLCAAERGEVWECAADAMSQYSACVAWAVIDSDTDEANRCALAANIRIDCCRGFERPGVICR